MKQPSFWRELFSLRDPMDRVEESVAGYIEAHQRRDTKFELFCAEKELIRRVAAWRSDPVLADLISELRELRGLALAAEDYLQAKERHKNTQQEDQNGS